MDSKKDTLAKGQGNQEVDVTKFVNIDNEPFDIYINGNLARHLEAGEEQTLVIWVAQVGAKHLVDKILQKQNIKDTNSDSPIRRSTFAKILPDMAVEREIQPLTPDAEKAALKEQLDKQQKVIDKMSGKDEARDAEFAELKKTVAKQAELIEKLAGKEIKKKGKPAKMATEVKPQSLEAEPKA